MQLHSALILGALALLTGCPKEPLSAADATDAAVAATDDATATTDDDAATHDNDATHDASTHDATTRDLGVVADAGSSTELVEYFNNGAPELDVVFHDPSGRVI